MPTIDVFFVIILFNFQLPNAEDSGKKCFAQLLRSYDPEMGGFSSAPKFPQPVNAELLFALHARGDREADRNKQVKTKKKHPFISHIKKITVSSFLTVAEKKVGFLSCFYSLESRVETVKSRPES